MENYKDFNKQNKEIDDKQSQLKKQMKELNKKKIKTKIETLDKQKDELKKDLLVSKDIQSKNDVN